MWSSGTNGSSSFISTAAPATGYPSDTSVPVNVTTCPSYTESGTASSTSRVPYGGDGAGCCCGGGRATKSSTVTL